MKSHGFCDGPGWRGGRRGTGATGHWPLVLGHTRFTVARTTMRDAGRMVAMGLGRAQAGGGGGGGEGAGPRIRGLSEVWHSKIEKPKFKLGQLFEFMTKWHKHTQAYVCICICGIRMGMHVKTVKDQLCLGAGYIGDAWRGSCSAVFSGWQMRNT